MMAMQHHICAGVGLESELIFSAYFGMSHLQCVSVPKKRVLKQDCTVVLKITKDASLFYLLGRLLLIESASIFTARLTWHAELA